MNYDYEQEYEASIVELYQASLALKETGYTNFNGENDDVLLNYDDAVRHFNEVSSKFFEDRPSRS